MPARFSLRRPSPARDAAPADGMVSEVQIELLIGHAKSLADRVDALSPLSEGDARRARAARVATLREVVAAGAATLAYRTATATSSERADRPKDR